MPIRNPNYYNLQSSRSYPLADDATATGDAGEHLPEDILADCHIRWPSPLGRCAYVGGVTVTPHLVTVVIMAASAPDALVHFVPLAAVTLTQPVDEQRPYDLTPLQPGVGGCIVFGNTGDAFSGRFSTPRQGLIVAKCARPYAPLPIPTLRKQGRDVGLQDLVSLIAGADVEIVKERVEIAGYGWREALVLRLLQTVASRNVLQAYIGPCDKRPESDTCDRTGIESVNEAVPDCTGNLNIQFVGLPAAPFANCGYPDAGLVLEGSTNLSDACLHQQQPEFFSGSDYCSGQSEYRYGASLGAFLAAMPVEDAMLSSEFVPHVWPYNEHFELPPRDFVVKTGGFTAEAGGYVTVDGSRRNVAVWAGHSVGLNKRCMVELELCSDYGLINGGLVLNYRVEDPANPYPEYLIAELDRHTGALRLRRFTGLTLVTEHSVLVPDPLYLDQRYRLTVTTQPGPVPGLAILDITAEAVNGGWRPVRFSYQTNKYGEEIGLFGVGTDRARTRFYNFSLGDR